MHLLNGLVQLLYGRGITDEATCYKVFRTEILRQLDLRCQRFEFCPEVTAKLCRLKIPIREMPIRYQPRTATEGKKIGWRDGLAAIWTLLHWRIRRFRPAQIRAGAEGPVIPADCTRTVLNQEWIKANGAVQR